MTPFEDAPPAESGRAAPAADVPGESRSQRLIRHGRRARLYLSAGLFIALLVVLIVLASANVRSVKLSWALGSTRVSLVWVMLGAAVLGWLLGICTSVFFRYRTRRRAG